MRTVYLDCISGIAGDMALSALVDLGADPDYIVSHLKKLPIDPFTMEFVKVDRRGITAKWLNLSFEDSNHTHEHTHEHSHDHGHTHEHTYSHSHDDGHTHEHTHEHSHDHGHTHEHTHSHSHDHGHTHEHSHSHAHDDDHSHEHRKAADIIRMIEASGLPGRVKERSLSIFRLIAEAEGKIHGMDPAEVHFHEVGAMDSILDVIGVCLALESLDASKIIVSPVPTGTGKLRMAHGLYPIPAPATAELLRGVPLSAFTAKGELTTPTGAGIVKALASGFGTLPAGTIDRIGYGAGTKDFEHPNVLRAILYAPEQAESTKETIVVLEAQVDDSTGETLGFAMERIFEAGALDVYYTPVYMKKNRPGVLITVLCHPANCTRCEEALLAETSTFGVRRSEWQRKALERQWIEVETSYGTIKVKQALDGGRIIRQSPEFEDAAQAARAFGVPLEAVYRAVYKQLQK
ncbi:TIGR00299 family protein [Paenibacillus sp. FSL H8-0548]|uniref:nickel pincer cofactor biosynthesis protein LarC n=1 Tax=Paenibacillus sp. FSL H8-0548 TaxID=1920422 RepID=UPI00096F4045|nr:nickel pincer cofactor biosynthesis protein LarC [Paenibacillus sp. FSL H8-0548]OMF22234.1 TIGR00299 family protein [Paenibacillus sp. FSL H8-0548]